MAEDADSRPKPSRVPKTGRGCQSKDASLVQWKQPSPETEVYRVSLDHETR